MDAFSRHATEHLSIDYRGIIWLDRLEGYDQEEADLPVAIGYQGVGAEWPKDLGERPDWLAFELVDLEDQRSEANWDGAEACVMAYMRAIGEPGRWQTWNGN